MCASLFSVTMAKTDCSISCRVFRREFPLSARDFVSRSNTGRRVESSSPLSSAASPATPLDTSSPPVLKMRLSRRQIFPCFSSSRLISTVLLFYLCILSSLHYVAASSRNTVKRPVTYGSAIVLVHVASGYKLFSGKISWGSGSGQQAVTAMPPDERTSPPSILWSVEPPQSSESLKRPVLSPVLQQQAEAVKGSSSSRSRRGTAAGAAEPLPALPTEGAAGELVPCGAMVVFEHAASKVTMQALGIASPISRNREVSAADGSQASVAGFKIICHGSSSKRWMTGEKITLQHFALGTNLQADKQHKFTPYNCGRGCPIEGHIEVSISNTAKTPNSWVWGSANDVWVAEPGLLLGPDRFAYMDSETDEEGAASKYEEL